MFYTLTLALPAVCVRANGCFLRFLNFMLAWYVAQVLSDWFRNGSSRHYYYWYHPIIIIIIIIIMIIVTFILLQI